RVALLRLRKPFGSPAEIGTLPEDRRISLPIRLKCDASTVGVPDRKPVLSAECEPAYRAGAGQVVDPHIGLPPVIDADGELLSVRRKPGVLIGARGKVQPFDAAAL